MKKEKKYRALILLSFLFIIGIVSFFYIIREFDNRDAISSVKDNKNIVVGDVSEPILGEASIDNCVTPNLGCLSPKVEKNNYCYEKNTSMGQGACYGYSGIFESGTCYYNATNKVALSCSKCANNYYRNGNKCTECPTGCTSDGTVGAASACTCSVYDVSGKGIIACSGGSVTADYTAVDNLNREVSAKWTVTGGTASCGTSKTCSVTFTGDGCGESFSASVKAGDKTKNITVYKYKAWSGPYTVYSDSKYGSSREQMKFSSGCDAYEDWEQVGSQYKGKHYYRCCGGGGGGSNPQPTTNPTTAPTNPTSAPATAAPEIKYCWRKTGNATNNEYRISSTSPGNGWVSIGEEGTVLCSESELCYVVNGREEYGMYNGQGYSLCQPACWGNAATLASSTVLKWGYGANFSNLAVKFPNVEQSDCVAIPQPTTCDPLQFESEIAKSGDTNSCEGEVSLEYTDGLKCQNGNAFYKIECDNKIITNFDYGNDGINGTTYNIKSGMGIDYKVDLTTTKKCSGEFYNSIWDVSYTNLINKQNKQTTYHDAEWWALDEVKRKLLNIVNAYNKWEPTINENNLSTSITLNTNLAVTTVNFEKDITSTGEFKKTTLKTITLKNGSQVKNFTYSNEKNEYKESVFPGSVEFDYRNGEYASSSSYKKVDGGNKIYTELKTSPGNYNISVNVTFENLKEKSENLTISKKNVCILNVYKNDLIYRVIDVTNPFINSDYTKGVNWLNDKYNYTKVIKSSIWSDSSLYSFYLSKENISLLKASNAQYAGTDEYLGICYLPDNLKDDITKKICSKMN